MTNRVAQQAGWIFSNTIQKQRGGSLQGIPLKPAEHRSALLR
jgi:hypothetical protein